MTPSEGVPARYRAYTRRDLDRIEPLKAMGTEALDAMRAVSAVLPFRVNSYVVENLIDWSKVPDDPIFRLTFPQPDMLHPDEFQHMLGLIRSRADEAQVQAAARRIQHSLNPHPAGQMELNRPRLPNGEPINGLQHKYRETVLFFPSQGQTCHAYCTYCFRWAQFVGIDDLKITNRDATSLATYVGAHPEVSSVLLTGGDPMVMRASVLRRLLEPLLDDGMEHIQSIRIGTKAPGYWPQRFLSDPDADELMSLFEEVVRRGKHLAVMAHYSHPRELSTPVAEAAVARIRSTGAVVRCQAPLIRGVNDDANTWAELWRKQVRLGAVPYYMFVERDTGPHQYFQVPLARAHAIYNDAVQQVSGLARTARGPSMSTTPGKVVVDGITTIGSEKVFALRFLQARNPNWVGRPFFAKYDPNAAWLDELKPAFGEREFFFESELRGQTGQGRRSLSVLQHAGLDAE